MGEKMSNIHFASWDSSAASRQRGRGDGRPGNCKEHDRDCAIVPACERSVCRAFDVSVPVTITPLAAAGPPEVICMGRVEEVHCHKRCHGDDNCHKFTFTQRIHVEIPLQFAAEVCYGETCAEDKGRCRQHHCSQDFES